MHLLDAPTLHTLCDNCNSQKVMVVMPFVLKVDPDTPIFLQCYMRFQLHIADSLFAGQAFFR